MNHNFAKILLDIFPGITYDSFYKFRKMQRRCYVASYFLSEIGSHRLKASPVQIWCRISHWSSFFEVLLAVYLWTDKIVGEDGMTRYVFWASMHVCVRQRTQWAGVCLFVLETWVVPRLIRPL